MKIAIDIDDVITNTSDILFVYLGKYDKVDLTDPKNNKLDIMRGKITCPELLDFYKEYAVKMAETVKLKSGVKEALKFLEKSAFELHIISGRIPATLDTTLNYFKKNNLPYDFLKVNVFDKKAYCEENKIDILIDDAIEICQDLKNTKTTPILFTSLVNKNLNRGDIIRLNSWNEIRT